jgi:hypothetical protein
MGGMQSQWTLTLKSCGLRVRKLRSTQVLTAATTATSLLDKRKEFATYMESASEEARDW